MKMNGQKTHRWKRILLPWAELKKVEEQLKLQRQVVDELERQLIKSKEEHKTKDQNMRRLGVILALKGGVAILFMLCLSLCAQPIERGPTTTNVVGFVGRQFNTNPVAAVPPTLSVVITNLATGDINGNMAIAVDGSVIDVGRSNAFNGLFAARSFAGMNNSTSSLPVVLFANRNNTDGSLFLCVSNSPFYGGISNIAAASGVMVDSICIGNPPNMGDGIGNPADGPFGHLGDSVLVGLHMANQATNISNSTLFGYGTLEGNNANDGGNGPFLIQNTLALGSSVGSIWGASNVIGCTLLGTDTGLAWGVGAGAITNCLAVGYGAGNLGGDVFNTNDICIGAFANLPHGHSGEMSIANLIYATNMNAHGRGFVGIGTVDPTNVLNVFGVTDSTYGNISKSRNTLVPVTIAVGASPFTFKNDGTAGNAGGTNNIYVFIDAGTVTSITLNGGQIFTGANSEATVPMQPGETIVVTYNVIPTMKYKPF
jgi:hypothetical protein